MLLSGLDVSLLVSVLHGLHIVIINHLLVIHLLILSVHVGFSPLHLYLLASQVINHPLVLIVCLLFVQVVQVVRIHLSQHVVPLAESIHLI